MPVADLGGGVSDVAEPEADEDLDDEAPAPAPRSGQVDPANPATHFFREPYPKPRRPAPPPLYRQTVTLDVPTDKTTVTLEVIVIASGRAFDDDVRTAEAWEVPALNQAGWSRHGVNNLEVFTRIIS